MKNTLFGLCLLLTISIQAQVTVSQGEPYSGDYTFSEVLIAAAEDGYTTQMFADDQYIIRSFSADHELLTETSSQPKYKGKTFYPGISYTLGGKHYTISSYSTARYPKELILIASQITDGKVENPKTFFQYDYSKFPKGKKLDHYGYYVQTGRLKKQLTTSEDGRSLVLTNYNWYASKKSIQQLDIVVFDENLEQVWRTTKPINHEKKEIFNPTKTLVGPDQTVYVLGYYDTNFGKSRRSVYIITDGQMKEFKIPLHSEVDIELIDQEMGGGCLISGLTGEELGDLRPTGVFQIALSKEGVIRKELTATFDEAVMQEIKGLPGAEWKYYTQQLDNGNTQFFMERVKRFVRALDSHSPANIPVIHAKNLVVMTYDQDLQFLNMVNIDKQVDTDTNPDLVYVSSDQIGDKVYIFFNQEKKGIVELTQKPFYELVTLDRSGALLDRAPVTVPSNKSKTRVNRRNLRFLDGRIFMIVGDGKEAIGSYVLLR